eukprot:gene7350-8169_t
MERSSKRRVLSRKSSTNKMLLQWLLILLVSSITTQYPHKNRNTHALLQYLRASMAKTQKSLSSPNSDSGLPILRRRQKNAMAKDLDESTKGGIGKRKYSLGQNPQLELEEAYKNFLQNHLNVKREADVKADYPIRNPASIEHKRKLFCRSGYLVEILPNGTVRGTQDHNSPYTQLTILMYARQLVIIRTEKPPFRYLVMTEDSRVSAVKERTLQSVFFYRVGNKKVSNNNHNYLTFQRVFKRKSNWFLAMKKKDNEKYGSMRRGKNTNPTKRSAQFIVVRY